MGGNGVRSTEYVDETISSVQSTAETRLIGKLQGHPQRYAIIEFLEYVPEGESVNAWALCLNGCLEGLGLHGGRPATIADLAAACNDYRGTAKWGIPHFRGFVDRLVAKRLRPKAADIRLPKASSTDRAVAAAKAFAEGGE